MRSKAVQDPGATLFQRLRLPERGGRILVAVSGGIDSMVLLYALKRLSVNHHWKLTVAHFNHCLRGRASDADEVLVRKTVAKMKLPLVSERADVKNFAKTAKLSIETAARKLRHEFFARVAKERKIKMIALAHHADDQVELFFLRLLRGSGGGGLAGMRWRSPSPADKRISLVRPLLDLSKADLETFARENKIRYREDATNLSPDFLRNRIRHELLSLLRKHYQPALNKTVLRLMEIVGAESDFASETAQSWLDVRPGQNNFEKLPVAIQRHVLRIQLVEFSITADFDLIESLRRSANELITVIANLSVSRNEKGQVNVYEHRATVFDESQLSVKLNEPGKAVFDKVKFEWQVSTRRKNLSWSKQTSGKAGTEFFDAEKIGEEIILRHWRAGDRLQPIGLQSATKLQDLFTNRKIPRQARHKLVVAETRGEIFWVEGLRISENFKLTPQTKRVLIWKWRR